MERKLTIAAHLFLDHLRILRGGGRPFLDFPAGFCQSAGGGARVIAARNPLPSGTFFRLATGQTAKLPPSDGQCLAFLQVTTRGPLRGHLRGWVRSPHATWQAMSVLSLPGPRMHKVLFGARQTGCPMDLSQESDASTRHSRTTGALGLETYERASALKAGVVGLGRIGSQLASHLVRFGLRHFVVVDTDRVELHNTGESDFAPSQVGQYKAEAWAEAMAAFDASVNIQGVKDSVTSSSAIEALRDCSVLFSAPDSAVARLAAGALSAAYSIPLIDVGTRIHCGPGWASMGADVRLVAPERCLWCLGGVANEAEGYRQLMSPDREEWESFFRISWDRERPGSLASLNTAAVGMAARAFEDFVTGRLDRSLWCHLEFLANGRAELSYPAPSPLGSKTCACGIAGWGDIGLRELTSILGRSQAGGEAA